MRRARSTQEGFTLLEVMVSLAILALALVVLLRIVTNNIQASNRAKLVTAATFLARGKIVELEDRVIALGFTDTNDEQGGDFSAEGYDAFTWTSFVERIELPTNLMQQAQGAASGMTTSSQSVGSQNPLQFMAGFMGGFMSTIIEPIRVGLQESVRRVTVRVFWREHGRGEQSLEIVTFMTDPSKLDLAMGLGAGTVAGGQGQLTPGQSGGTGTGAQGSSGSGSGSSGSGSSGASPGSSTGVPR
jgi:general secretion pathway protein I